MIGYRDKFRQERLQNQIDELKSKGIVPDSYTLDHSINLMPGNILLLRIKTQLKFTRRWTSAG